MCFGEKVMQVFKEIIKLLSLIVWKWGVDIYKYFSGWEAIGGYPIEDVLLWMLIDSLLPALLITWLFGWFCRLFNAPPLSLLYKPNKKYGNISSYERTKTATHDVYDNSGGKVGTIKTDEGTETVYTEDTRKYVPRYLRMFFYFFYFPINRVLSVFFSIVALFTKKFYVTSRGGIDFGFYE